LKLFFFFVTILEDKKCDPKKKLYLAKKKVVPGKF
jgi:hypothetical protein